MLEKTSRQLIFRPLLEAADAAKIEQILHRTGVFYAEEIPVARELLDECLSQGPDSYYRCFVAQANNQLLGYALYVEVAATQGTFELYWLAVDPEIQGQGIGRRLMSELEQQVLAAHGRRIYISTSAKPEYESARKLYASCGYKLAGRLPDYFRQGDDLLYFYKVLEAGL